jgi:FtsP/CotA-like multicopper oxidase with cupredoxin domain
MQMQRGKIMVRAKLVIALIFPITVAVGGAHASTTINSPEYRKPILSRDSQTNAWTNVIPNALASYFTYVPYRTADAVKLGFPRTCGRLPDDPASSEDCYTITAKKFPQQLALPGIFGGGVGLLDPAGNTFGAITNVYGYGSGGKGWAPPGAPAGVTVTGNAPAPFVDNTFATTGIWHFPAPTIKGTKGRPVRVQWLNELPNEKPTNFDPTICDNMPMDCFPYNRIVTHAHGAHVTPESDGFANSWYTPLFAEKGNAWQSTTQHGPEGTYRYPMDQEAGTLWYHDHATGLTHVNTNMGLAGFFPVTDDNEKALQGLSPGSASTKVLPTGDYELGFALQDRVFYVDGQLAMPDMPIIDARDIVDPGNLANPLNCTYTYQANGTITPNNLATCPNTPLFMKDLNDGLADAEHHLIPYVAGAGVQPLIATSSTLEFFGNMPVVNGVVYGKYNVEPRVYRMRFIGGTDSRTWIMRLKIAGTGTDSVTNPARYLPFWQIGTEQALLNSPVKRESMLLMGGERLDVLVDFNGTEVLNDQGQTVVNAQGVPLVYNLVGKTIIVENWASDSPYGGEPIRSVKAVTTEGVTSHRSEDIPEIMRFDVSVAKSAVTDVPPPNAAMVLRNAIQSLPLDPQVPVRKVSLREITDQYGRIMPTIDGRGFGGEITELIRLNDTEQWDIINTTVDAHPMHLHQVAFQLINRENINVLGTDPASGEPIHDVTFAGVAPGALTAPDYVVSQPPGSTIETPAAHEAGWKDTIMCPPGKVTRVKAKFDIPGIYVWHCHILSHEEHDMMRPFIVTTPAAQVNLTASSNAQPGVPATQVTFTASTTTSLPDYPDGSGFEYQFSVTPPPGVTVTQPVPMVSSMLKGAAPGYSLVREAIWSPPAIPGTYAVTVNAKALGSVSDTNPVKTATLNFTISEASATTAIGDLDGNNRVELTDALRALRISAGLDKPTTDERIRGDVAPLVNGIPSPDGVIDNGDVLIILKRLLGIITW